MENFSETLLKAKKMHPADKADNQGKAIDRAVEKGAPSSVQVQQDLWIVYKLGVDVLSQTKKFKKGNDSQINTKIEQRMQEKG